MHFRIAHGHWKKEAFSVYSLLGKNGPMGINSFASIILFDHEWQPSSSKGVRKTQMVNKK